MGGFFPRVIESLCMCTQIAMWTWKATNRTVQQSQQSCSFWRIVLNSMKFINSFSGNFFPKRHVGCIIFILNRAHLCILRAPK